MPRHIHESTELDLICLLKEGKSAGSSVAFTVLHDNVEVKQLAGSVVADARARAGKSATAKYTPPLVADDKTHYVITYKAVADGETYLGGDEIHVWPRKGKLDSRNEDDTKPLKNFIFKVVQNGALSDDVYKAEAKTEGGPAVAEFRLAAGAPFALEGAAPYEIVGQPAPQGGKLRDLKSKNKINFTSEFVSPAPPADGQIKQWVNLVADPAKKGADGLGTELEVTVGVKGDRTAAGATIAVAMGEAGMFVHVKVRFSGPDSRKSKRSQPKTDLAAGLNLVGRVAVKEAPADTEWDYKGRVELAAAGGVGKFKLVLGLAGGDTCLVSIGSTAACGDAVLTFTNWRKIWYELMAPDVMALEDGSAEDATPVRDFPAAMRAAIKTAGDPTFVAYAIHRSQSFSEDEALATCPGSILKREFFQRSTGPTKCYVLTDYTFTKYPKTFDRGKGARASLIKTCDVNLFSDGPGVEADLVVRLDCTAAQVSYDLAANGHACVWSPSSAFGGGAGAASIRTLSWEALFADKSVYHGAADAVVDEAVDDPSRVGGVGDAVFMVRETLQGGSCSVTFRNPRIGHTATSLDSAAKAAIDAWLVTLWTDAKVRPHGFKLHFSVAGRLGNSRRDERGTALKTYILAKVGAGPKLYKHPGLNPDGSVKGGNLVVADVLDMARSHWGLIAVNLPAAASGDPGTVVGVEDATHCPVGLHITVEPQHVGLGMAGQGLQRGEMVLDLDPAAPKCVADTALHEFGHQYFLSHVAHGLPGIDPAKGIGELEPLARYRDTGSMGNFYTGMDHSGGHCAWGLSDANKALPDPTGFRGLSGKCIMFGAMGRDDGSSEMTGFCPQCSDHVRAQDLNALK